MVTKATRSGGFRGLWCCLGSGLLLTACQALAPGNPLATQRIDADDTLQVTVVAAAAIPIGDEEKVRFAQTVAEHTRQRAAMAAGDGAAHAWRIEVRVDRYDEGDAFKRSVRAGMGAMHIDAVVTLGDAQSGTPVGSFDVRKTYDWGGAMGAQATIFELEVMTAERIAKSLVVAPVEDVAATTGAAGKTAPKRESGAKQGIRRHPW